ncbi:hypothetical protein X809_33730 [Paenibacillus polymyxa CR1]|nr:hypothetical protein X809_33730 [Paenibacillus polymyxa CR1]ODB57341.1 hypothetical protein A7309_06005 [Paenibacillus polymyxa]
MREEAKKSSTSYNIIFNHQAYSLGPAEDFRGSKGSRTHPTPSDVVNTGTLCEIIQKEKNKK